MSSEAQNTNFFPENYIQFDHAAGNIALTSGENALFAPTTLLAALAKTLLAEVQNSPEILYRAGKQWGADFFGVFDKMVVQLNPGLTSSSELDMEVFLADLSSVMASLGWGRFEFVPTEDILFIKTTAPAFAMSVPESGTTYCQLFAGLMGGLFSIISGNDLECIDVDLKSPEGFTYILTDTDGAAAITGLKAEGLDKDQILARLTGG